VELLRDLNGDGPLLALLLAHRERVRLVARLP
jgi:hypothetical protein